MAQYVLENEKEADRLERMSRLFAYQPAEELTPLRFAPGMKVLDAGCGSGLVARHIADHNPGVAVEACDLSPVRVQQAQQIRAGEKGPPIRYFQSSVDAIQAPDNSYDCVSCRYVFEFLPDPVAALREFVRVLKPGGRALVVQFDGFLFNFAHQSDELESMLTKIREGDPFRLFLGRHLPKLFAQAGLREVDWEVKVYGWKKEQLEGEAQQVWERLDFAAAGLAKYLGSEQAAHRFRDLYREEMLRAGNVLFYNKFLVSGSKQK